LHEKRALKENIGIREGDGRLERLNYHVLHDLYFFLYIISHQTYEDETTG
jgi:hypothetical protein